MIMRNAGLNTLSGVCVCVCVDFLWMDPTVKLVKDGAYISGYIKQGFFSLFVFIMVKSGSLKHMCCLFPHGR